MWFRPKPVLKSKDASFPTVFRYSGFLLDNCTDLAIAKSANQLTDLAIAKSANQLTDLTIAKSANQLTDLAIAKSANQLSLIHI